MKLHREVFEIEINESYTQFDIRSALVLLKVSKSVAMIIVLLIIVKMNHDRGKTSMLTTALTVGSLLLVYELGVLIGLIPFYSVNYGLR